ncbi:MAG: hypothetical protein K0R55_3242 [Sporomusa sp.]|nr:hypothetical protein [Sporomusa sp.]
MVQLKKQRWIQMVGQYMNKGEKSMEDVRILQEKVSKIKQELRNAVDLSLEIRAQSSESKEEVIKIWEILLKDLFGYIKQRSKEAKDNLLSGVSWTRLKLF